MRDGCCRIGCQCTRNTTAFPAGLSFRCMEPCTVGMAFHGGLHRCDRHRGKDSTVELTHDQLDCIQKIGRNEENNNTSIGLGELDALVEYCRRLKTRSEDCDGMNNLERQIKGLDQILDDVIKENGSLKNKLKKKDQEPVWNAADGRKLRAADFVDGHLINTIKYIERIPATEPEELICDYDGDAGPVMDSGKPAGPDRFPIYPLLLAEARKRKLTLERPSVGRPCTVFKHQGLKSVHNASRFPSDVSYSIYIPSEVGCSEEFYREVNDQVRRTGECFLELVVLP